MVSIVAMLTWLVAEDYLPNLMAGDQPCPSPVPPGSVEFDPPLSVLGELEPTYDLRDLACLRFPDHYGDHELSREYRWGIATGHVAEYTLTGGTASFTVDTVNTPTAFTVYVSHLADPVMVGDAVCGTTATQQGERTDCLMAGVRGLLRVRGADGSATPQDVARIVQDFYAFS